MNLSRSAIGRFFAISAASIALVLVYPAVSTAIQPPAPAGEAADADGAAAGGPGTMPEEIDEARLIAGMEIWKESGCRGCHGWAANGEREGPSPQGPSLRETVLPFEAILLTVTCGRPGTEMPYYWRDAYRRDSTDCYGQTGDALGDLIPLRGDVRHQPEELEDLAYYLAFYVKGQGEISFEQCQFYWGEDSTRCPSYQTDAELEAAAD